MKMIKISILFFYTVFTITALHANQITNVEHLAADHAITSVTSQEVVETWSFFDEEGIETTCRWIDESMLTSESKLARERVVFINAYSDLYRDIPLSKLKVNSLPDFLDASFTEELNALQNQHKKTYALSAQQGDCVVGYASFSKTGIPGQVYIKQAIVDPTLKNQDLEYKMILSIFKKLPQTKHLIVAARRLDTVTRARFKSFGFQECMYHHEGPNPELYIGLEFQVPENAHFDEANLSFTYIPYSGKKINWQQAGK